MFLNQASSPFKIFCLFLFIFCKGFSLSSVNRNKDFGDYSSYLRTKLSIKPDIIGTCGFLIVGSFVKKKRYQIKKRPWNNP